MYDDYCQALSELYPSVQRTAPVRDLLSPNLISAHVLELPQIAITQATAAVEAFFALRQCPAYQARVDALAIDASARASAANFGALMSYDFHWTGHDLKLIEINTNASSSLLVDLLYRTHQIANPFGFDFRDELIETFRNEFKIWSAGAKQSRELKTIAIVDETPAQQRMYIEFLMYKDFFESSGYHCVIADPSELRIDSGEITTLDGTRIDLVYNRDTDFYLQAPKSAVLREAYLSNLTCVTPHPREYALLADKERLLELSKPGALAETGLSTEHAQAIDSVLLKSFDAKDFTPEDLWAQRKKFFFKPKRSYGGKAVYRGSSISRKPFQAMLEGEVVAQEYAPPSEVEVAIDTQTKQLFKYDLRFYAYENRIQSVGARLYQGQTTNVKVLGGGLAPIKIQT